MRCTKPLLFAVALFAIATAPAHAADQPDPALDAAPSGLASSQTKISTILAKHAATLGKQPASLTEDWTFVETGLRGFEHLIRSGTDYHSTVTIEAGTNEYGQLDGKRWHKDIAGFTTPTTGTEQTSFYVVRTTEDASDPKNDVSLAGETVGTAPAYVLKVTNRALKHPEWIFYDAATYRIVRVETVVGKHRSADAFDDFRTMDGVDQPWHFHNYAWVPEHDSDWRLTSYRPGSAVPASAFAQPVNPPTQSVSMRASLPAQFRGGAVLLRLTIAGRGYDFILDPSVRTSLVDFEAARQMGLSSYGQTTKLSTGERVYYDSILPDADLGPIHLHDFPVHVTRVGWYPDQATRIVGALGYDFLMSNIVHVDFVHHLAEVMPTSSFAPEPAKPVANELDIPMQFDDGALLVPMAIGSGFTERVALSPAVPFEMIFGDYAAANGLTPQDSDKLDSSYVPFADNASYGRTFRDWLVRTNVLAFANLNLTDLTALATAEPYDDRSIDAIVGYNYLRYYDIYFDYPHARLLLVPNERFAALTAKIKPGTP